jgi:hypothetical protein
MGKVILLHNDEPARRETFEIARVNASPRAVFTGFTAAELLRLTGWRRDTVQLLVPQGVPVPRMAFAPVRIHRGIPVTSRGPCDALPAALVRAASVVSEPGTACGLLAAGVQQRLVRADDLTDALAGQPRVRHRKLLQLAVADIGQGAQALSEIDFVRLCRRHRLPLPRLQAIRSGPFGRRYLDAEWDLPGGGTLAVEIDGALHLVPATWWHDQLRQNELVLAGCTVLRYPSVVVRTDPERVVEQLKRALLG